MRIALKKINSAFTLVELLVVISIIAVLLAILMPALNKVRMQGQTAVCGADLKQISLANTLYVQENRGRICSPWTFQFGIKNNLRPGFPGYENSWMWQWSTFSTQIVDGIQIRKMTEDQLQEKVFKTGMLYPYLKTSKVWLCPGAPKKKINCANPQYLFGFPPYWSYTCNGTPGWTHPGSIGDLSIKPENIKPSASRVFLYMEQYRNTSKNPKDWDSSPFDNTVTLFAQYVPGNDSITDMHNGGGNLTFYDGHIEKMKRTEWIRRMSQPSEICSFAGNYNFR